MPGFRGDFNMRYGGDEDDLPGRNKGKGTREEKHESFADCSTCRADHKASKRI